MLRLIRLPEVIDRVGLSRSTICMFMQQGKFPKSIKLGSRAVAWSSKEIDAWIQDKVDQFKSVD